MERKWDRRNPRAKVRRWWARQPRAEIRGEDAGIRYRALVRKNWEVRVSIATNSDWSGNWSTISTYEESVDESARNFFDGDPNVGSLDVMRKFTRIQSSPQNTRARTKFLHEWNCAFPISVFSFGKLPKDTFENIAASGFPPRVLQVFPTSGAYLLGQTGLASFRKRGIDICEIWYVGEKYSKIAKQMFLSPYVKIWSSSSFPECKGDPRGNHRLSGAEFRIHERQSK